MKIKISKDYFLMQALFASDKNLLRRGTHVTTFSDYNGTWEEKEVTLEELAEYAKANYAIKINC